MVGFAGGSYPSNDDNGTVLPDTQMRHINGKLHFGGCASAYTAIRRFTDYLNDNPRNVVWASFELSDWLKANGFKM